MLPEDFQTTYSFEELPLLREGNRFSVLASGSATIDYDEHGDWTIEGIQLEAMSGTIRPAKASPIVLRPRTYTGIPSVWWEIVHAALMADRESIEVHVQEQLSDDRAFVETAAGGDAAPGARCRRRAVTGMDAVIAPDEAHGLVDFETGPLAFSAWLKLVDAEVVRITSLGHDDFNDWGYADAFADGVEPVQAARDMLAEDVTGAQFLELAGLEGGW